MNEETTTTTVVEETVVEETVVEVVATSVEEAEVESNFVPNADGYISFGSAAKLLGVRYQQVFQRAVDKNKMAWRQTPTNEVLLSDVLSWKESRSKR